MGCGTCPRPPGHRTPDRGHMSRVVVLISGRGSNMQALIAAGIRADGSDQQPTRRARVSIARERRRGSGNGGPPTLSDRASFDAALAACIDHHAPDLVVLAGFMRILGADFVNRYAGRLMNIHPSLLPAFPGSTRIAAPPGRMQDPRLHRPPRHARTRSRPDHRPGGGPGSGRRRRGFPRGYPRARAGARPGEYPTGSPCGGQSRLAGGAAVAPSVRNASRRTRSV
jgi:hypothetical protein